MTTAYLSHPDCARHDMGRGHPEAPGRIGAIEQALVEANLMASLAVYDAPLASAEQLARAHDQTYVDEIFQRAPKSGTEFLDPDTCMNAFSLSAALRASGAVVSAVELVLGGAATHAFCNVRPPGHHAEYNNAMGFCIFNNIAVGVAHALAEFQLQRVAIVDFDVHHGNGTEDIFRDERRVLMCQTYQSPFYPHSGDESQPGHIVNASLPAGSDGSAFRRTVEQTWLPELESFQPEVIFISAGFDGHRDDPLADLALREADYAWVTERIVEVANRFGQGRIVSSLEGGYNLKALALSAAAHVEALLRG